jgi:hypothetical protein
MSAIWSPNADDYMSGKIPVNEIICVLCGNSPCCCPPFGTEAYFVLIDFRHGRITADDPKFTKYFRIPRKD